MMMFNTFAGSMSSQGNWHSGLAAQPRHPSAYLWLDARRNQTGASESVALQRLLPRVADQLLLGALCAAFFDEEGQPLQQPQITLTGVLLPLEDTASSDAAFGALRRMLDELGVSLPYAPGSKQKVKVACTVGSATKSQPALLQDLRLGGQAVLVDGLADDHPHRLSVLLGSPQSHQCKGPLLLGLLSREYLVPLARLELSGTRHVAPLYRSCRHTDTAAKLTKLVGVIAA